MFGKKKNKKYYDIKNYFDNIADMEVANHKHLEELGKKVNEELKWVTEHNRAKDQYINTLESKQRTIEALTNALCDKYNHGLFIYSEDGKVPMVIRNGKELTNDMTTEFSISWCPGEIPSIQIEQVAATSRDDEE